MAGPSTNPIECYIINLVTNTKIEFLCNPEDVSENIASTFDAQTVRGRTAPFVGYDNTGPRTVSVSFIVNADLEGDAKTALTNFKRKVNAIRALAYPEYQGQYIKPPVCFVRIGKMVSMRAITEGVSVSWSLPYSEGLYRQAEISLEFTQIHNTPATCYGASDVENDKLFGVN